MFHVDLDRGRGVGDRKGSGEVRKGRSLVTSGRGMEVPDADGREKINCGLGPTLLIGLAVSSY